MIIVLRVDTCLVYCVVCMCCDTRRTFSHSEPLPVNSCHGGAGGSSGPPIIGPSGRLGSRTKNLSIQCVCVCVCVCASSGVPGHGGASPPGGIGVRVPGAGGG